MGKKVFEELRERFSGSLICPCEDRTLPLGQTPIGKLLQGLGRGTTSPDLRFESISVVTNVKTDNRGAKVEQEEELGSNCLHPRKRYCWLKLDSSSGDSEKCLDSSYFERRLNGICRWIG